VTLENKEINPDEYPDTDITEYRKGLVLEQVLARLQLARESNRILDEKADRLMQAGALVMALLSLVSLSSLLSIIPKEAAIVGIVIAGGVFIVMIITSFSATIPEENPMVGPEDWEEAYNDYLYKDDERSFQQVLSDVFEVTDRIQALNANKALRVQRSGKLFIGLVVVLAIVLILSVIAPLF